MRFAGTQSHSEWTISETHCVLCRPFNEAFLYPPYTHNTHTKLINALMANTTHKHTNKTLMFINETVQKESKQKRNLKMLKKEGKLFVL